jgi:formylglycine-generating enzyme required for sulfatase activity
VRPNVRHGASVVLVTMVALSAHGADPPDDDDPDDARPASTTPPAPATSPRAPAKPEIDAHGMLRVPGATFAMGSSDPHAPPNERPPRTITVKPFSIDRTEVTVLDYRACVEKKRCAPPPRTHAACTFELGDPELPINCVRWSDADAFCRASGKRLPTEAEWELAARGPGSNLYPWGNSKPSCALAVTLVREMSPKACSGARPAKVGTHAAGASPFGALDMVGNVEEWVSDFYSEHVASVAPRAGASHVLRGGGWLSAPSASRATTRNWGSTMEAGPNVGFRCARSG